LALARAVAEKGGVISGFLWVRELNLLGGNLMGGRCRTWRRHPTGSLRNAQGGFTRASAS
jgi:hypothetical protein